MSLDITNLQEETQKDPTFFFDHVLGAAHWSKQDEIIRSVFTNYQTTVKSCHGIGKSYIAARVGITFLHAFTNSIVLTTAPTFRQVENIIWREWRGAVATSKVPLGGKVLKVQHELAENWYALGVSADKPDNFQGYHAEHILVIVDEAAGVSDSIMNAIEALMTSANVRLLYIGNPTTGGGKFFDSHKDQYFEKISVSVFDTPNFKYNGIKDMEDLKRFTTREQLMKLELPYPKLVTPYWAWMRLHAWGEFSPMFQSRVLAIFPSEGDDTLIPLSLALAATTREVFKEKGVISIGVDVARFGSDTTVIIVKDHKNHKETYFHQGKDINWALGKIKELDEKYKSDNIVVDDTGVGGGVTDGLKEWKRKDGTRPRVIAINFGSNPDGNFFKNIEFDSIKAEIFWLLKMEFQEGKITVLDEGRLISDIASVKYEYTSKQKILIVSKKEMKKQGLKSPDFADALALANYGTKIGSGGNAMKNLTTKDPGIAAGIEDEIF